jgi:hypothetical protein
MSKTLHGNAAKEMKITQIASELGRDRKMLYARNKNISKLLLLLFWVSILIKYVEPFIFNFCTALAQKCFALLTLIHVLL